MVFFDICRFDSTYDELNYCINQLNDEYNYDYDFSNDFTLGNEAIAYDKSIPMSRHIENLCLNILSSINKTNNVNFKNDTNILCYSPWNDKFYLVFVDDSYGDFEKIYYYELDNDFEETYLVQEVRKSIGRPLNIPLFTSFSLEELDMNENDDDKDNEIISTNHNDISGHSEFYRYSINNSYNNELTKSNNDTNNDIEDFKEEKLDTSKIKLVNIYDYDNDFNEEKQSFFGRLFGRKND